jgi:hypothetical protein
MAKYKRKQPWHGRLHIPDSDDKNHLMEPNKKAAKEITHKSWPYGGKLLDQGPTSECVGYSGWEYLFTSPVRNKPKLSPSKLYKKAQQWDQWEGDNYEGSSVRGMFKYLHKEAGYLSEYKWAFDGETAVAQLLTASPVLVGTNWYPAMDDTDKHGYIWPEGGAADYGHAYLIIGANRLRKNPDGTKGAVRMINSWGKWGDKGSGRAWITFQAFDFLIKEDGEAGIGVELLVA